MVTKTFKYEELADALIASGAISDMATEHEGWKHLALMLADLGEGARHIFNRLSSCANNYDSKQTNNIFTWALNHYDPMKGGIGSFLYLCEEAGIDKNEYLTDDPLALRPSSRNNGNGYNGKKGYRKPPYKPKQLPTDSKLYSFPSNWIKARMPETYESSPLARYLARKFGWEKVNEAFKMYWVGVTQKPIPISGNTYLPIGSCIFPEIDEKGMVRTAQIMAFDDERGNFGHRSKDIVTKKGYLTWMHFLMINQLLKATDNKWGWEDNRRRKPYNCISGAHLLNEKAYPTLVGKPVGIVESMSTALCMTCAKPDMVWLATAGDSGIKLLKDAVLRDVPSLKNRQIVVFPDEGKTDTWRKSVEEVGLEHVSVSDFMDRQKIHGGDIKDIVMGATGTFETLPKEPINTVITPSVVFNRMKSEYPIIATMEEKFDLVPTFDFSQIDEEPPF